MDWCWSWSSNILGTWCEETAHWERPWSWQGLKAGWEGGDRGWDGWIVSLAQWTWIWANSMRQWRTGKPGVLQFMGSQRVGHNLGTEYQQADISEDEIFPLVEWASAKKWAPSHRMYWHWDSRRLSIRKTERLGGFCVSGNIQRILYNLKIHHSIHDVYLPQISAL